MLEVLRSNVVLVKFTKKDGTERTMTCTLMSHYVPFIAPDPLVEKKAIVVWDLNKVQVRSFLPDEVNSFEVHG